MKKLWSLILIGLAFGSTAAVQAQEEEQDASEDFQAAFGCPSESYCFFDSAGFAGRRLILSACDGTQQPLNPLGFAKRVSSWTNNSPWRIIVLDAYGNPLWIESPYSRDPELAPGKDNLAWYYRCIK